MPLGLPAAGIVRTPDNFEAPIKAFVDGLETATSAATAAAAAATTAVAQKYTKPGAGIPASDLDAAAQALLGGVRVRRYVAGAWEVRGTTSAAVTVLWLKPLAADPDPPINATYFLAGTDVLIKASA